MFVENKNDIAIVLAVDPGEKTGWASIALETEEVLESGELKAKDPKFIELLGAELAAADILIIEDQYFDKSIDNPDSLIKLAALRGEIQGYFTIIKGFRRCDNICCVKASLWQACLKLPVKASREQRKRASRKLASFQVGRQDITENEADAINMGLAVVRRLKAERLIKAEV